MICQRCHRQISTAAATVTARNAVMAYGPKCAAAMGIMPGRVSVPARRRVVGQDDERQADWIQEVMQ